MYDTNFTDIDLDIFPQSMWEREQWMQHVDKHAYAPWSDPDDPAPCNEEDHAETAANCLCDARYKWGWDGNWRNGATARRDWRDPRMDGIAFIQQDADPYLYVDGDDVRDTKTGDVHPAFRAMLAHFGPTYTDISQSGAGVHAIYEGDLPNGVKQASWQLDDEPWGDNDETPSIEIYPGKRVCVMTGSHVAETPAETRPINRGVLVPILEANGQAPGVGGESARQEYDLSDYDPEVTGSGEETDDIRDVYSALNRIDCRAVAEKTIVYEWNDEATTTAGNRAFYPIWGKNSNGTANIANEDIWQDTGDYGGYGGPATLGAIDAGEISPRNALPVNGLAWRVGVERLRELGFEIPHLSEKANHKYVCEKWVDKVRGGEADPSDPPWEAIQYIVDEYDLADPSSGGTGAWATYRAACRILKVDYGLSEMVIDDDTDENPNVIIP